MAIYQRLKECREDKNMMQTQIAAILGINQRAYSAYETGKRKISIEYLMKLADVYETSVDYLLGLTNTRIPHERKRVKQANLCR